MQNRCLPIENVLPCPPSACHACPRPSSCQQFTCSLMWGTCTRHTRKGVSQLLSSFSAMPMSRHMFEHVFVAGEVERRRGRCLVRRACDGRRGIFGMQMSLSAHAIYMHAGRRVEMDYKGTRLHCSVRACRPRDAPAQFLQGQCRH